MIQGIDRWRDIALRMCIVALLVAVGHPRVALAATHPAWPVESTRILVRFEERYEADRTLTHRGVDIAARAGEPVRSPLPGEVSFVGPVPAGEGRTRLAVSLRLADGRTLTFLPLDSLRVGEGDRVLPGDTLATVSPGGDLSHPEVHLHVGLRDGGTYRDPLSVLTPPGSVIQAPAAEAVAPASVPAQPVAPSASPVALAPVSAVPQVVAVPAEAPVSAAPPVVPAAGSIPSAVAIAESPPVPAHEAHVFSGSALAERMGRLEGGAGASAAGSLVAEVDAGAEDGVPTGFFSGVRGRMGVEDSFAPGLATIAPLAIALVAAPVVVSLTRTGRRSSGPGVSQDEGVRPRGQTVAAATGR